MWKSSANPGEQDRRCFALAHICDTEWQRPLSTSTWHSAGYTGLEVKVGRLCSTYQVYLAQGVLDSHFCEIAWQGRFWMQRGGDVLP